MTNLLVVEDSLESFAVIRKSIADVGVVHWARTLKEAESALKSKRFDLLVLDVCLPDGDGFKLCSLIRTQERLGDLPVIMVSARNHVGDRVMGLSVGAQDYIGKPFASEELKWRVKANLRRRHLDHQSRSLLTSGEIQLQTDASQAWVTEDGQRRELQLTSIEFRLLKLLMARPNAVLSREEILRLVWGENCYVCQRSPDTHVSKLRKKLGRHRNRIRAVHGSGYKFLAVPAQMFFV